MQKAILAALAMTAALATGRAAEAITVTATYHGHITSVGPHLTPAFSVGETFTYTFSYMTSVPDQNNNPEIGDYSLDYLGTEPITFSGGAGLFMNPLHPCGIDCGGLEVFNGALEDNFNVESAMLTTNVDNRIGQHWDLIETRFTLLDTTAKVFSSDALPHSYLSPGLFSPGSELRLTFELVQDGRPNIDEYIHAQIDGVTPIPPTLGLFASALAALGVVRWRSRKSSGVKPVQ
jgi:hypothetical protein